MAGMRAGAGEEVITPFDMKALKKALLTACQRSRKKQEKTKQNPVVHFFEKTMKAATFAEAGDFDTAISMMDDQEQNKKNRNNTADTTDKKSDKN
jgi:hypothetical protein